MPRLFSLDLQQLLFSKHKLRHLFIRRIILEIRRRPGPRTDPASSYVALSRATSLDDIHLLFPVNLSDLTWPRNQDVVALIGLLQRLLIGEASISVFNSHPSTFTPKSASLPLDSDDSDEHDSTTTSTPRGGTRRDRSHRSQRRSPTPSVYLILNRDNDFFLNAALGLALVAFDGQSLPGCSKCTPAAVAFFSALVIIKDNMHEGNPLQQNMYW